MTPEQRARICQMSKILDHVASTALSMYEIGASIKTIQRDSAYLLEKCGVDMIDSLYVSERLVGHIKKLNRGATLEDLKSAMRSK